MKLLRQKLKGVVIILAVGLFFVLEAGLGYIRDDHSGDELQ